MSTKEHDLLRRTLVKIVESTVRGPQSGATGASTKPSVKVPMPQNPVKSEPLKGSSPKALVSLLNQIEALMGQEDMSPEDKGRLEQAHKLVTSKVQSMSVKENTLAAVTKEMVEQVVAEALPKIDYEEEKRRREADRTISKARGLEKNDPIATGDQETKADGFAALKKRR